MPGVPGRLKDVRARLDAAAWRAGRKPAEITLVGVTKTVFPEEIEAGYDAGLRHFGESRWQEAEPKLARLRREGAEWHFIGRLQANKLQRILENFDWVQSLADTELVEKAEGHLAELGAKRNALLQINISGEASKAGFSYGDAKAFLKEPLGARFPHIALRGLMAIGPQAEAPAVREAFRRLHGFYVEAKGLQKSFDTLSMGMSGDFEIAVEEGSTMVRVGTAIFGERS